MKTEEIDLCVKVLEKLEVVVGSEKERGIIKDASIIIHQYSIKNINGLLYSYRLYKELDDNIRELSMQSDFLSAISKRVDKTLKWLYNNMEIFNKNGRVLAEECVEILCLLRVCNDKETIEEGQGRIIELLKQIKM